MTMIVTLEPIALAVYEPVPDKPGYTRLARRRTPKEIVTDLRARLATLEDPGGGPYTMLESMDYFSLHVRYEPETEHAPYRSTSSIEDAPIPTHHWVACYAVQGKSEGWYTGSFSSRGSGDEGKSGPGLGSIVATGGGDVRGSGRA